MTTIAELRIKADQLRGRAQRADVAREHIDSLNVQIDKLLGEMAPLVRSRDEWRATLANAEAAADELREVKQKLAPQSEAAK